MGKRKYYNFEIFLIENIINWFDLYSLDCLKLLGTHFFTSFFAYILFKAFLFYCIKVFFLSLSLPIGNAINFEFIYSNKFNAKESMLNEKYLIYLKSAINYKMLGVGAFIRRWPFIINN